MGNTGSAITQVVLSAAAVTVGAVVAVASFGGASVLAGTLISAGVSGATTAITNAAQKKPASWAEWGKSTAIGAATGLIGGALCAGAGGLAKGLTEGVKWTTKAVLAVKGGCIVGGSMASSLACNTISNVSQGRKPMDGWHVALAAGAAGGAFACAGAASFHTLKHSTTGWLSNPLTRHSTSVVLDTTSSVVGSVIGAAMTDQDIGNAALLGLATGATVSAFTTSMRGAAKRKIRYDQRLERENRVAYAQREQNGVTFEFEQGIDDVSRGHRDERHVDKHRTQLKERLDNPDNAHLDGSTRFYDLDTANQVRKNALPLAANRINAMETPALVATNRQFLLDKITQLENLQASGTATPKQLAKAQNKVVNAQKRFAETVANKMNVSVNVPTPEGCGYGYKQDRARVDHIRSAVSCFQGRGQPDGSITWREISSYPDIRVAPPFERVMVQMMRVGDRWNRRQVAGNVLAQQNVVRRRYREEEELSYLT